MRSFGKIGLLLLLVFAFSLFCLAVAVAVALLCFLCRRRRQRKQPLAGDAELGFKGAFFNLCCTIQSRVEPAGESPVLCSSGDQQVKISSAAAAVEDAEEECSLAMWRAVTFGPSRVLYTIKEEEREGMEFEEKEEEDLFATPCESPAFYTPASSPARAPEKEVDFAVWVSPAPEKGFRIS